MTLDAAGLADVPVGPLAIRAYLRHCFLPSDGSDPDPLWVDAAAPSRWQTDDGTLYVAEDETTVWAEQCRNAPASVQEADPTGDVGLNAANIAFFAPQALNPPVQARALFSVHVELDHVADFTAAAARDALRATGVDDPDTDLLADDYGPCREIAKAGYKLGWEAVRAPSAAKSGGVALAMFHDAWPPPGDWAIEQPSARPSVAVAYLTRYRDGERPAWLGAPPPPL